MIQHNDQNTLVKDSGMTTTNLKHDANNHYWATTVRVRKWRLKQSTKLHNWRRQTSRCPSDGYAPREKEAEEAQSSYLFKVQLCSATSQLSILDETSVRWRCQR
ncbi:hypothetical protein Pcinc_026430 [Petrolisthes cinctipes]|uniref:Uncharacterized protein n=1 Tax=Petrolisthes cinctipes TaxID=88211 RepID=A0AAE1F643_PETCI|nr:hypothetical protein Pcinc_026430 [Petrolisthes cinctipes]